MIELAFTACLSTAPDTCESKALQFSDLSMMACVVGAQAQLAEWAGEHPGWHIRRWTCQPPRTVDRT
jgi:hypothetical protein